MSNLGERFPFQRLVPIWNKVRHYPGAVRIFSWAIGQVAPYSGTISPRLETFEVGHVVVSLKEHRRVRNHLGSVHAIALINLAELASGLAILTRMPPTHKGIIGGLSIEYVKKSRGKIFAESSAENIVFENRDQEVPVSVTLKNAAGEIVATAHAKWKFRPKG